jgi:hypothetical protein
MTPSGKHDTKEQMPGLLARLDDPFGITWRAANTIRRLDPARTARFVRAWLNPRSHRAPILIVGMPRSGTQLLFHVLRESSELGGMPREGHDAWRAYHHPRRWGWRGDRVRAGQVQPGERRFISAWFSSFCGNRRLVEKTADNLVRIPYLLELFPDAMFVVMKRNPCDVLNSYINMWRQPHGRFRSYFVPAHLRIPGYPHAHRWCSTLVEGWQDLISSPVPQIALAQWSEYVNCLDEARRLVPATQWLELSFEDVLATPHATMKAVYERLDLTPQPAVDAKLAELLANPINTLSPPGHEKWRTENEEEISELLPRIIGPAALLGYRVDPSSGAIC